ncbi:nuclear protein 96-domain-containing protein [Dipodascopsis uninucleata]
MFGQSSGTGSAFGGFGANNSNTNQNSLFGGSSSGSAPAFGTNNSSNSTPAFGQPSGFGTTNNTGSGLFSQNNNQSSGFGGFGNANTNTNSSVFGSTPGGFGSTGSGLFGNTANNNTPATSSSFGFEGSNNSGTTAFGTTQNSTSPFGQTNAPSGGLFGSTANKPAFGGFGSTTGNTSTPSAFGGGFGSSSVGSTNQGTAATPFEPLREKDMTSNSTNVFQSISSMPAYSKFSFEELREQDYAQGRRYGNATGAGAFGKSTGFGTGSFGQSSAFGQTSGGTSGTGLFGSTGNQTSGFGATPGFGANNNTSNTSGGLFGQKPSSGLFGSTAPATNAATGLFGGSNANSTGGFGSTTSTSPFGQTSNSISSNTGSFGSGGGLFGQNSSNNQAKPAFGSTATGGGFFGGSTSSTTTPAFGSTSAPAFGSTNSNTGGGLFGSNNTANNTSSPFGQMNNNTNNNTTTSPFGGFGSNNNNTANSQSTGFGTFGSTNQNKPTFGTGFGVSNTTNTTTPSLFGQNNQNSNQNKPAGFGGFGQNQTSQNTSGGLFGNAASSAPQGGSLFNTATNNSGASLLGASNTQTNTGAGLFGAKPQTGGGLFGGTQNANTGGSLFGSNNNSFGNANNQNTGSMFGPNNQNQGMSLFGGGSQNGLMGNQQNQLQASIDQNPFGSNPLFNSVSQPMTSSPGPLATPISSASSGKKKPALLPTYKLSPRPPSSIRSKGAARSVSSSFVSSSTSSQPILSTSRSMLFDGLADKAILSSDAFSPRNDIRKLVIDRKVTEADLLSGGHDLTKIHDTSNNSEKRVNFAITNEPIDSLDTGSATPKGSVNGILKQSSVVDNNKPSNSITSEKPKNSATVTSSTDSLSSASSSLISSSKPSRSEELDEYWSSPNATTLRKMSIKELESVANFKIGRRGYGEVMFRQPVDLSSFAHPEDIPGQIVVISHKVLIVYPDDSIKPPVGQGLNVPATITLEKCYPIAKDTKEPITEVDHPLVPTHIRRLQGVKDTEFIAYIADTGTWVFNIEHFSIWGILENEDEYDIAEYSSERLASETQIPVLSKTMNESDSSLPTYSPMKTDSVSVKRLITRSDETSNVFTPSNNLAEINEMSFDFRPEDTPLRHRSFVPVRSDLKGQKSSAFGIYSSSIDDNRIYQEEEEAVSDAEHEMYMNDEETNNMNLQDDNIVSNLENDEGLVQTPDDDLEDYISDQELVNVSQVPVGDDWAEQIELLRDPTTLWRETDSLKSSLQELKNETVQNESYRFTFSDLDSEIFGGEKYFNRADKVSSSDASNTNKIISIFGPDGLLHCFKHGSWTSHTINSSSERLVPNFEFIEIFREYSTKSVRSNTLLKFKPIPELSFGHLKEYYMKLVNVNKIITDIWSLASILFDEIEIEPELVSPAVNRSVALERIRKCKLSQFFKLLVKDDVEADINSQPSNAIFFLLSGHQIEEACIRSIKENNLHLATLLSLTGGDYDFRSDIDKQINDWIKADVLNEIPESIRRIYEVLRGNVSVSAAGSGTQSIFISENLDWRRAFALRLWYEIFEEESVHEAVRRYEEAIKKYSSVKAPLRGRNTDILFGLLKLYSNNEYPIERVILPGSISSNILDFSISWQLCSIMLSGKGIGRNSSDSICAADKLAVDFAWQLENAGEWKRALFVLLHLHDDIACRASIQRILNHHVPEFLDSETANYLLKDLEIPKVMILNAQALNAHSNHDYYQEAKCLLEAQDWTEAHEVIVQEVGPSAVISENYGPLIELLSHFKNVSILPKWKFGGQIYLDFVNVIKCFQGVESDTWWPRGVKGVPVQDTSAQDSMERLRSSLPLISTSNMGISSRAAIHEIANVVGVEL